MYSSCTHMTTSLIKAIQSTDNLFSIKNAHTTQIFASTGIKKQGKITLVPTCSIPEKF